MRKENFINKFLIDNNRDYWQTIQYAIILYATRFSFFSISTNKGLNYMLKP